MAVHDFASQRLFLETELVKGAVHVCSKDQTNYLRNVLRLAAGDQVLVFNGVDGEWLSQLEVSGKRSCALVLVEQVREQVMGPDLDYLFAPLKRARLDYMVQKATELGVSSLRPIMTERTIVGRVNTARMRANVIEAAEQCGVLRLPVVHEPLKLASAVQAWPADRSFFFADEAAAVESPLRAFEGLERGAPMAVIVGPEGGFSDAERRLIRAMPNARTVSLGPRIMRADTAAVALLALVNAAVGDWAA